MLKKRETETRIKNWGKLHIPISKKTRKLWGKLSPAAIEIMKRNISDPRAKPFTEDEFQRVLKKVSHPIERNRMPD